MAVTKQKKGKITKLYDHLRGEILAGIFEPGTLLPPQTQLSREHGMAESTASAAVGQLVAEGLAVRIHGRGSFVAEQLPVRYEILDFVRMKAPVGTQDRSWVLSWIEDFTHLSEQRGWTPRWHHVLEEQMGQFERLAARLADSRGVILFYDLPLQLAWLLHQRGVPAVSVFLVPGGLGEKAECFPQITYDRQETARLATEHLVSTGYRRIVFVGSDYSMVRIAGFLDVLSANKLLTLPNWWVRTTLDVGNLGRERTQIRSILEAQDRPEAFCCATKDLARAVKSVAEDLGLRVPEDLAIVACDEGEPELPGEPGITTVGTSREQICRKALDLIEQLRCRLDREDGRLWEPIVMPIELKVKDSCGARLKGTDGLRRKQ